jgi:hypothetical protein
MSSLRIVLLVVGILTAIPAILAVAAGTLGVAGVLADVGPAANQRLGIQAFNFAAPFVAISTILFAFSYFAKRFDSKSPDERESDSSSE